MNSLSVNIIYSSASVFEHSKCSEIYFVSSGKTKLLVVDLINGESPRENFDTLGNSILTIFEVLMGAGWSDIMFSVMRCVGSSGAVYFVILVIVGGIILLNLFLAIMLGNFEKSKQFG